MSKNTRIIEVNGVKMEVDLREAKEIKHHKIGDVVKVLKEDYSDNWKTYYGVIVDFTHFKNMPAIDVLYVKEDYSDVDIKFETITENTTSMEIASVNRIEVEFTRGDVLEKFNKKIESKKEEIRMLEAKKKVFKEHFGDMFDEYNRSE